MKRYIGLLALVGALLSGAQASTLDFDNDPGSGYQFYFPGGANLIVLDDVNRTTTLEIKQVNIGFFNSNQTAVNVTLYVFEADSNGLVSNLLYTSTITGVANGISQLQFAGSPTTAGKRLSSISCSPSSAPTDARSPP